MVMELLSNRFLFLPALLVLACGGSSVPDEDHAGAHIDVATPVDQYSTADGVADLDARASGEGRGDAKGGEVLPDGVDGGAPLPAVLNLATDADRNGKVSFTDPDDEELEESWSLKSGAVFLLNLDDDDGDGLATFLEVLDAQVSLIRTKSTLINSIHEARIQEMNLKALLGVLDLEYENE